MSEELDPGLLVADEPHPMTEDALNYCARALGSERGLVVYESMAKIAMTGDRASQVCFETARRIMEGESVPDRDILGLAWMLRSIDHQARQWVSEILAQQNESKEA